MMLSLFPPRYSQSAKWRSSPYCFTLSIILRLIGIRLMYTCSGRRRRFLLSHSINRQTFSVAGALLIFFNPRTGTSFTKDLFSSHCNGNPPTEVSRQNISTVELIIQANNSMAHEIALCSDDN